MSCNMLEFENGVNIESRYGSKFLTLTKVVHGYFVGVSHLVGFLYLGVR